MEQLVLKGITHPGVHEVDEGIVSVGRNPTNDVRISDPTVSSFHCELIISEGTVLVHDLNSTNGTYIEGQPVREGVLKAGQTLRLGQAEVRLEVQHLPQPVVAIPTPPRPPTAAPEPVSAPGEKVVPCCVNHPDAPSVLVCPKCGNAFCSECLHTLGLQGGQVRLFCPSCSHPCEAPEGIDLTAEKKPSFFSRLTQTIRIRRVKEP